MVHVYVTYPTQKEAKAISSRIIRARLAACINFTPVQVWYWWKNKVVKRPKEIVSIISTEKKHVAMIQKVIRRHHSYTVPCILVLPVTTGFTPYLDWVREETR